MNGRQRSYFVHQLSCWFHSVDWHYTTLLSSAILAIDNLPDDIDQLVNQLLLAFPVKPAQNDISHFLAQHPLLGAWFIWSPEKPKIVEYSLQGNVPIRDENTGSPQLETINDLLFWFGITGPQLDWLCDVKSLNSACPDHLRHYHYHCIAKRSGGVRLIESPKTLLKSLQQKIANNILCHAPIHKAAHGFRAKHSCLSHASKHSGKSYLLVYDLAHFFQSIDWLPVYQVFRNLGYNKLISINLTNLCTHRCRSDVPELSQLDPEQRQRVKRRHLTQGAPSSPVLSNAVMLRLDRRLSGLAKSAGLTYSRYADDLAFSTNQSRDWRFLEPLVGSICIEEGLELNFKKSRRKASHQRQKLVGIIINNRPNIDRRYYDELKAILHNCIRHGAASQNRHNHPDFPAYLSGRIQYVNTLNPDKAEKLKSLYQRIDFSKS